MENHGWREQYTKGWGVESHNRGKLREEVEPEERQGTSVGEGRGGRVVRQSSESDGARQMHRIPTQEDLCWVREHRRACCAKIRTV